MLEEWNGGKRCYELRVVGCHLTSCDLRKERAEEPKTVRGLRLEAKVNQDRGSGVREKE